MPNIKLCYSNVYILYSTIMFYRLRRNQLLRLWLGTDSVYPPVVGHVA